MEDNIEQEYRPVLLEIILALKGKIGILIAVALVFAILGWCVSSFLISPQYEASVNMIVNTRTDISTNVTNDNISSAQNLVDTYAIIIKSNVVLNQVIDNLKLDMSYDELYDRVSVSAINNTQVMKIAARDESAQTAGRIVENIALIAPEIVVDAVEAGSCKVVSTVDIDYDPVYPDIPKITIIAGFLGMVGCIAVILLRALFRDCIVDDADVQRKLKIPTLGVIPEVGERGTEKSNHNKQKYSNPDSLRNKEIPTILAKNISFPYVEAFKTLRTNLEFMSSTSSAKCILVTSAMQEESKTTTVINLALSMASGGHSVVVVECDLRKPSLRKHLKYERGVQGLSAILNGKATVEECIIRLDDLGISVIHAGAIPANPSELLSQSKMQEVIAELKQRYDYVILDAPPVTVVTDAAVIGRRTDGALLVIRSEFASAKNVQLAKNRLEAVNIQVLGAVLTRFDIRKSGWRYGYDYKGYTYGYGQRKM